MDQGCYMNMRLEQDLNECIIFCEGLYADVVKTMDVFKPEEMRKFDKFVENYDNYKRGFHKDIEYTKDIAGML